MLWLWYAAKLRLKSTQWEGWCKTSFLSWRGDYKDRVQIKRKINQTPNILSVFTLKGRKVICKNIKTVWKESQCSSLICCTFAAHTAVWPVEGWGDHTDSRAASIGFYPSHQWPGGVVELILQDSYSVESFLHFFFFFYLGSNQRVKPLDRFIVRYEAVHPVHVQHYLTKSWRKGEWERQTKERHGRKEHRDGQSYGITVDVFIIS